jgi:Beta-lactamase enzyme family
VRGRSGVVLGLVVLAALVAVSTAEAGPWGNRRDKAARFVERRVGVESFAFIDDRGRMHGYRARRVAPSASLLKAILLVAYLNKSSVRDRDLTDHDRSLLGPMIRRSDNTAASTVLSIVGSAAVYRVARRAQMRDFRLVLPIWGLSEVTARDQARFFYKIDRRVVLRHRRYALWLLGHIVRSQRWGIAPETPPHWWIHFKGGWGSGTGRVTHQSALLRRGKKRLALCVLTQWNPSHYYGTKTIQGVARRFLHTPLPVAQ